MSYEINKTNGNAITVLDGTKNTTATSLTLVGRLSQSYGEAFNENFALASAPSYPITGQLWYDTVTDNIKAFNGSNWFPVGSNIIGNVDLSGNLFVGPNNFTVQDIGGNVTFFNQSLDKNIIFKSNVNYVNTTILTINGSTGLLEVNANATSNYGVTTKIYVDSEIVKIGDGANVALAANMALVYANLAIRTDTENNLSSRIDAANAAILLKDTVSRVNSINSAIDTAIQANVATINSNVNGVISLVNIETVNANANVVAANIEISNLRANVTAVNVVIASLTSNLGQTNTDITSLAPKASPQLTGVPVAPTAASGTNTTQIATTAFVRTEVLTNGRWEGSRRYIQTTNPTASDGSDGDFWFKYS